MSDAVDNNMSLLVIDDNIINRKVLTACLKKIGLSKISVADDGLKALNMCKKEDYDVIILDLMMPIMDGFDFLREFTNLKNEYESDIIVHTAAVCKDIYKRCMKLGVIYFMEKPIDNNLLKNLLEIITIKRKYE